MVIREKSADEEGKGRKKDTDGMKRV